MKFLHIMRNDKFINPFITFINKNFSNDNNKFIVIDGSTEIELVDYKNTERYISIGKNNSKNVKIILMILQLPFLFIKLFINYVKADKIYFHGLFEPRHILFLYIFRFFLKKSSWIMWGGDLYYYYFKKDTRLTLKKKIYFYFDKKVKGSFNSYITFMKGDYRIMQEYCSGKGKLELSFTYPSNFYKEINLKKQKKEEIWIQLGNSEDPDNNHFEILEKIKKFKDLKIKCFCILSYVDELTEYKKNVIKKGREYFKENFVPVTSFMPYDEYLEFLGNIDIAIFAHNRAQAFGNTTSLLSMEKTIYLKKETSTYETLTDMGIKVKTFDELNTLEMFDEETLKNNKKIMKEKFSEKELIKQWERIFNS
ncbi:MAG: TDP-N-acetylfucosamine:lipid II N-acetylfucosaminyltransferase [Fusobacterium sp.]|uniref:TDP-N-acetylfucosamine:lipid II N-acetylfucosaminyltransferase n=1 Tax=Fusobacterium sp. TaxID=68766 RepID=UPI0026DCDF5B|nr:TDP-N-acetylfucosamine:lipid II N-acetylfucosaminyltransferase [Fusobacterium sp.]MDO4690244.1 TDP-N-acetylfucosamine:lipid II N-acetylfucosaminyltransferase [Fusobacterium sp.]